ncbi:MAG: hypothetical protein LBQ71_22135 [Hungatella sp.]|nr:hypothetical protein [Hungatella sp.]
MKKLKFAIIGCGEIFLSHWEGYVEQRENIKRSLGKRLQFSKIRMIYYTVRQIFR